MKLKISFTVVDPINKAQKHSIKKQDSKNKVPTIRSKI